MKQLLLVSNGLNSEAIKNVFKDVFVETPRNAKAVIIPTASAEWKSEHKGAVAARDFLLDIGYKKVDFLDVEFENPQKLYQYQVVYINGGNPFYLLYHLKKSGADKVLKEMYEKGALITGGSAGAVVFCPDLQIVSHFAPEYELEILTDYAALNFVPFTVLPHANRYKALDKRLAEISKIIEQEICLINDGAGILVQDDKVFYI